MSIRPYKSPCRPDVAKHYGASGLPFSQITPIRDPSLSAASRNRRTGCTNAAEHMDVRERRMPRLLNGCPTHLRRTEGDLVLPEMTMTFLPQILDADSLI